VTDKNKNRQVTGYFKANFSFLDYKAEADADPGMGHFILRMAEKGNQLLEGKGIVHDCLCTGDGTISADNAMIEVPSVVLTNNDVSDETKKRLLSNDVRIIVGRK
jgi:hypothetical protein